MNIKNSILDTIGKTPIVRLNNLGENMGEVLLKLEYFNPCGSTKDRVALEMIEEAEKNGKLKKGMRVLEATSGNTGIGLAMVCASKGYPLTIVMPDNMSQERLLLLKVFGATVELVSGSLGMKGCMAKLEELKKTSVSFFHPDQFSNSSNPEIHYRTTAEEILEDTEGDIDIFICGTGTGGSFSGVSKKLKEKIPKLKSYAVEPATSPLLSEGFIGSHRIQGMGMSLGVIPETFDTLQADGILTSHCSDAEKTVLSLAKNQGIFLGISSGAVVDVALKLAQLPENRDKKILVLCADGGERYLSVVENFLP